MKTYEDFEIKEKCSDQEIEEAMMWFWLYVKCQANKNCNGSCIECSFNYDSLTSNMKIKYYKIAHDCILYYIKLEKDFHVFMKKINVRLKDFPELTEELKELKGVKDDKTDNL